MKALFIADLHLCEQVPANTRAFLTFLETTAPRADALYILGDLFEYWAGDDDETPLSTAVADALARVVERGTTAYFVAGNRDFLLGPAFAARAHLTLLPDPSPISLNGRRFLVSHGDALCTDDAAYQQFRRQVRDPGWRQDFLAQPLAQRRQLIEQLRRHSESAKREKPLEIMDVNHAAVADLLREHGYPWLIHGHTHRPARHELRIDGRHCERWVLSDWHGRPTYLEWNEGRLAFGGGE